MKHLLFLLFLFTFAIAHAGDKIPILYFYEADCLDCGRINKTVMPVILEKYGEKIQVIKRNVDEMKNFEAMMAFETKYRIPPQEVPEFYTSNGVTWKPDKIKNELSNFIDQELKSDKSGKYAEFLNNYLKTGKTGLSVIEVIQQQYSGESRRGGKSKSRKVEGAKSRKVEEAKRRRGEKAKVRKVKKSGRRGRRSVVGGPWSKRNCGFANFANRVAVIATA